ncbi:MAG: hypothetical protein CMK59_12380 [Proteobacteria bacterium]|nr:hypothetical protein [Pseudomonadota bacterium]
MPNRLHKPQKLIRKKERPFNDEDTRIQIREDFAHYYVRDPLWRHALEEPLIRMGITSPALLDMESAYEDDDIGVRTRERHLPQMPVHQEFLEGMSSAQDPLLTRDLEITLRHYNDAIRWDSEFARVFVLGMLRQLRQWVQSQTPETEPQSAEALLWVKDVLVPRLSTDMSVLDAYLTPEQDLEEMRRWIYEADNLNREINVRLQINEDTEENKPLFEDLSLDSHEDKENFKSPGAYQTESQKNIFVQSNDSSTQQPSAQKTSTDRPWLNFLIDSMENKGQKKADPEKVEELCSVIEHLTDDGDLSKEEVDLAQKLQLVLSIGESINLSDLEDYDAFESLTQTLDAEILAQQEEQARVIRNNIAVSVQDNEADENSDEDSDEEASLEAELLDELDPENKD